MLQNMACHLFCVFWCCSAKFSSGVSGSSWQPADLSFPGENLYFLCSKKPFAKTFHFASSASNYFSRKERTAWHSDSQYLEQHLWHFGSLMRRCAISLYTSSNHHYNFTAALIDGSTWKSFPTISRLLPQSPPFFGCRTNKLWSCYRQYDP